MLWSKVLGTTGRLTFRTYTTASATRIPRLKTLIRSFYTSQGDRSRHPTINTFMGDNIVNFYAGQPPLNRLSFQRPSADKLNAHLNAAEARFILFKEGRPLVKKGELGHTLYVTKKDLEGRLEDFSAPSPEDASNKDRARLFESARLSPDLPALIFLGVDDRPIASADSVPAKIDPLEPQGVPYFALCIYDSFEVEGGEWGDARASASAMDGWEAGVFAQARALVDWNARNKFCAACGSPTYSLWGGWKRSCSTGIKPVEGKEPCFSLKGLHNFAYPRTDPVIIMGILDASGEKMLLGRQKAWPKGMYSCLAGFIEPGESFEDAVRREVMEEAGIEVGPVRYSSSQPWPYPSNVMVGCYGRAKDGQTIRTDLDNELEDAQWFPRELIVSLLASAAGTNLTRHDLKKLEDIANSNQEQANALAPADKKPDEGVSVSSIQEAERGITRVPPGTAIAGQLIKLWAEGKLNEVSRL